MELPLTCSAGERRCRSLLPPRYPVIPAFPGPEPFSNCALSHPCCSFPSTANNNNNNSPKSCLVPGATAPSPRASPSLRPHHHGTRGQ